MRSSPNCRCIDCIVANMGRLLGVGVNCGWRGRFAASRASGRECYAYRLRTAEEQLLCLGQQTPSLAPGSSTQTPMLDRGPGEVVGEASK